MNISQRPTNLSENKSESIQIRTFINSDYQHTHQQMLSTTLTRIAQKKQGIDTANELWIVEHNNVYTLGQAGKEEHILRRDATPIIHTDRGGQVTWHGSGQLVIYWLIDLDKVGWSVRDLVSHAEQSIEDTINATFQQCKSPDNTHFYAKARKDAPGVYIYNAIDADESLMLGKIASLGFKIKHGFSYHGIAVNLTCDLTAFNSINPCGYAGMQMLRLADFINLDKINTAEHPNLRQGLDIIKGSVTELAFTKRLTDNIIQRLDNLIKLRNSNNAH